MKTFFKSCLLSLLVSTLSHAAGSYVPGLMYQVGISSMTTNIISVSTFAATQVDNPVLAQRVSIEIQNIDSTANLWCLPGVSLSSAPVTSSRKIAAGAAWVVSMRDTLLRPSSTSNSSIDIFCTSDGTASTKAAVSQAY